MEEARQIKEELVRDLDSFLSRSTLCFPPFVACVQVRDPRDSTPVILSVSWLPVSILSRYVYIEGCILLCICSYLHEKNGFNSKHMEKLF